MSGDAGREPAGDTPPRVRALLGGIVDYAGLFPPAALTMDRAVENFASYRRGADAWALGRFVVPAARLEELGSAIAALPDAGGVDGWRVSALIGEEPSGDLERVRAFNAAAEAAARDVVVDSLELKGWSEAEIRSVLRSAPRGFAAYVEVPLESDLTSLLHAVCEGGARAKVRTGGVTEEMFPAPAALLRFLRECVELDLPFKATAGLHHPMAGRYPLTYEPGSRTSMMYGYLNLLVATALIRRGAPEEVALAALRENDRGAFRLGADEVAWREHALGPEEVAALRERAFVSFGSCSFREPVDELPSGARAEPGSSGRALAP